LYSRGGILLSAAMFFKISGPVKYIIIIIIIIINYMDTMKGDSQVWLMSDVRGLTLILMLVTI
jgi:hypothetical protein